MVGGDEHLVGVGGRRDAQINGVELLLCEHLVVICIDRARLVLGCLLLEGFLAFVAKGLENDLAFLGEGCQRRQVRPLGDPAEADAANADRFHQQFLLKR